MSALAWLVVSWVGVWLAALLVSPDTGIDTGLGMAGPLSAAVLSGGLLERIRPRGPRAVTSFLVKAFAAKMVFFGAYVIIMLTVLSLEPRPFVISFTACFLVLHVAEAMRLRQWSTGGGDASTAGQG